jgi:hypothetical protein
MLQPPIPLFVLVLVVAKKSRLHFLKRQTGVLLPTKVVIWAKIGWYPAFE